MQVKAASRMEEARKQSDLVQPKTVLEAGDVSMEGLGPAPVETAAWFNLRVYYRNMFCLHCIRSVY